MRQTHLIVLLLALSLGTSGCIANMGDLKDRVGAGEGEPIAPAATASPEETPVPNATKVLQPPVARIAIFGENGALVFKSSFQAEDPGAPVYVPEGAKLSLIASDSEALEPGATLVSFAWTVAGKPIGEGRQASFEIPEAGLFPVKLVIMDSEGSKDEQTVAVAVAPTPIEVVTELLTGPVAGAEGAGQAGSVVFDLTLAAAGVEPVTIQSVTFVARSPATCDAILDVLDAEGASLGATDGSGIGGAETLEKGALPEGSYTVLVGPYACVAAEVPVTVTVVYLPIVEGLPEGDGHAHAH